MARQRSVMRWAGGIAVLTADYDVAEACVEERLPEDVQRGGRRGVSFGGALLLHFLLLFC